MPMLLEGCANKNVIGKYKPKKVIARSYSNNKWKAMGDDKKK
jgi:hypothetical protein